MYSIRTPAKLNTFLNVNAKRSDGLHNISTHLQLIDIYDELSFSPAKFNTLVCGYPELNKDNIVIKSIEYFNQKYGANHNFNVALKKNIPFGAGLGGGSSNAAYTLILLCLISGIDLGDLDLNDIGKSLGADIPFFIQSKSCYVSGYGEILEEQYSLNKEFLVISPNINVKTEEVFNSKYLNLENNLNKNINSLLKPLLKQNDKFAKFYQNIIKKSDNFKNRVKLTGSGSSLFIESPTTEEKAILQPKIEDNFRIFLVKGLEYYDFAKDWGVAKW